MSIALGIGVVVVLIVFLVFTVKKARNANREQSSTEMHPDNFKKPKIERVEKKEKN